MNVVHIHPSDNVVVALHPLTQGTVVEGDVTALSEIRAGHKVAIQPIAKGEPVIKYGYSIGVASVDIKPGEWIHSHNLVSAMASKLERGGYKANGSTTASKKIEATFEGYRRPNGSVGIRNEVWVINTVGCVNHTATRIVEQASKQIAGKFPNVDGIYTFNHPFGCSQLGGDLESTQKLLAGLSRHANAGAVLVLGLGCENNQMKDFIALIGETNEKRLKYFNSQEVGDELEHGVAAVVELAEYANQFKRETVPASALVVGMKCGGSDGLSGITANPLVGRIADKLAAAGGTTILTEVPEMFGAEQVLLDRACSAVAYDETIDLVNDFRDYFRKHNEPIDENPSPGNKDGGITTLAEKSLGCVQKGGTSPINQVLRYGEQVKPGNPGIALLNGPGNDGVSGSALSAAGAHMVLFTTGRGNPMGFPVPTVKISTNTPLATNKPNWIDFSAGEAADGTATLDELADRLFEQLLDIASGRKQTRNEVYGYREIAIWKDGVTL